MLGLSWPHFSMVMCDCDSKIPTYDNCLTCVRYDKFACNRIEVTACGTLTIKGCPKIISADFFTASAAAAQACTQVGRPEATQSSLQE